jgi:hypothetical protein
VRSDSTRPVPARSAAAISARADATDAAERRPTAEGDNVEMQVAERPLGVFSRQLFLGEALDTTTSPPITTPAS